MRLSRAILVMLLLHIVAVGGIFAFSFIKERDSSRISSDPENPVAGALEAEDSHLAAKPDTAGSSRAKSDSTSKPARPAVHVVRAGETLTRIANDHGVTLEALVAANGTSTVTNGLHPGQELKLPDRSPEPDNPPTDSATRALDLIEGRNNAIKNIPPALKDAHTLADSGKTYVVAKGDTAASIAQKLKISYDALLKLNRIDDPKKLNPGQKLRLPSAIKPRGKLD